MTVIGVYDDLGNKVNLENASAVLGKEVASLLGSNDKPSELSDIDASPSRLITPKFFCRNQSYFNHTLPVYVYYKTLWPAVRGKIIHAGLYLPNKERVLKTTIVGNYKSYVVGGVMDGYDEDRRLLWEIKTTRKMPTSPKPEHVYQTMIYKHIGAPNGVIIEECNFLYINDMRWQIMTKEIPDMDVSSLEKDIQIYQIYRTTRGNCGPIKDESCISCDYWRFCPYSKETFKKNMVLDRVKPPSCLENQEVVSVEEALREM